jgi:hypothetical protein
MVVTLYLGQEILEHILAKWLGAAAITCFGSIPSSALFIENPGSSASLN